MLSDQPDKQNARPNQPINDDGDAATPRSPQPDLARNLADHSPSELCFHNVTPATLEVLLADRFPDIARIVSCDLYQTILDGADIPVETIHICYTGERQYWITQHRSIQLGNGGAQETSHAITIEVLVDEEPLLFTLSLATSKIRSLDFTISLERLYEEVKWAEINAWGAAVGVDLLSSLFTRTPPERWDWTEQGTCISHVSSDISLLTTLISADVSATDEEEVTIHPARWIPHSIQVSSPSYEDQMTIISQFSAELAELLRTSGLLRTLDAFGTGDATLKIPLLSKAGAHVPGLMSIEFSRRVNLGDTTSYELGDDDFPEDAGEDIDAPSDYSQRQEAQTPFSSTPLFDRSVLSSASIFWVSDADESVRVELLSCAQTVGRHLIRSPHPFNFAAPVLVVTFLNDSPTYRQLATRWRALSQISLQVGAAIGRRDLEPNLTRPNPSVAQVPTHFASGRVLMSFDPPRRVDTSPDAASES